jgi:hypothetical protein
MKTTSKFNYWLPVALALSSTLTACGGGGAESAPVFEPIVPQASFTNAAGPSFRVMSGSTAPLNCVGPAGSTYQWVIEDNSGISIELSNDKTAKSSFVAPVVTVPSNISLACRMTATRTTPASGAIAAFTMSTTVSSRVVVTVDPPEAPTLVTTISGNQTTAPGTRLSLTANAGWFDKKGVATTGPVINYTWSLAGAPDGTLLTPVNGSPKVDVVVPTKVMGVISFPVTVTTNAGGSTSQATVTVLVDPSGGVPITLSPVAQSVQSGAVVSITATRVGSMFYQWSVVKGPIVPLGGASSNIVGFVAPTIPPAVAPAVAAPINMTLRVAIGYEPISESNPGVYFLDSVVTVKP